MGRLLTTAGFAAAVLLARVAGAAAFDWSVDLRAVSSDAGSSRLDGGLGKLRFDPQHAGLRLGEARFSYRGDVTETVRVAADGVAYGDHDVNPIDLTELYADWRPIPRSIWRSRLKFGAFYPEISLENRKHGWDSPYTLTWSALDTWVGEELRTIGAEYSLDWLGRSNGHAFDVSLNAAAFGWNDPAGTVIAARGWGLTDRQSTLFGRFATGGHPLAERTLFYDDMDKRAGYHAGLSGNYRGLLELHALHYDNRASLAPYSETIDDTTWRTYFDSLGARWTPTVELTLIAQWLHGRTYAGTALPVNAWGFHAEFLLASWQRGALRYSARYDRFGSQQTASAFLAYVNNVYFGDRGHAWTLCAARRFDRHWSALLEGVEVHSWVAQRTLPVAGNGPGANANATERQWQLALRYER
ncbi:MAG: hypothetical protein KGJ52_06725 [Gammaproteobacteria bacterium]|nr:hypothetical protein [Gammaproteobacteria bacterium]